MLEKSKLNLLIDCTPISCGKIENLSIALYTVKLLQGFSNSETFNVYAAIKENQVSFLDKLAGCDIPKIVIPGSGLVTPWPIVDRILGLCPFKHELKEKKISIVLSPDAIECRYFFPKKFHQHAIVHDLNPYYWMKESSGKLKYFIWRCYRSFLFRKIPHYISISEFTRRQVLKFEGRDSFVVYNSIPFDMSVKEKVVEIGKPYILDINRLSRYKNPETLVVAFSMIKNEIPHILYLKGDERHVENYENLKRLISSLGIEDRIIIDRSYRTEGEMRYLYSHADLFVSPSLLEGFGWTPVEAAVLKTPVLVSDIEVIKEVTCGRVPTFDPHSPKDLAERMLTILMYPPSLDERAELADFFFEKYSLKQQTDTLTKVLLKDFQGKEKRP